MNEMELRVETGKRLAAARKQAHLTQAEAGKAIQKSQSNYARYEMGIYELNYNQIVTLCKLFDCSADFILGLTESV